MVCLDRPYHSKIVKGPQILLGSFLNTLTHIGIAYLTEFTMNNWQTGLYVI